MNELAFQMFKYVNAGYCCTQVMMKMALEAEEKENEDLMRAINGLCMGVGSTQKICGVLTGGFAILGLYAGKGKDTEYQKPEYSDMVDEYTTWFESEYGSTECSDLIGVCTVTDYLTNQEYRLKCGDLMRKSYEKIQEILRDHDFEFGVRE
jgi:C_GCAxxG_C_C family probable redox protein